MPARGGYGVQNTADYNFDGNTVLSAKDAPANPGPQYGYTKDGIGYLVGNTDSYLNAVNQQAEWDRENMLRGEANKWDSEQVDRLVSAAKRNGINPIFLLDAINGGMSSASYTTSAAKANSYDSNAKTAEANSAKIAGSLIAALALIIAAL